MSEPLMHYGSHGGAECGAHGDGRCDESTLTKDPALVTCPTCRGWLPIVANWKPKPLVAAPVPCAASPADPQRLIDAFAGVRAIIDEINAAATRDSGEFYSVLTYYAQRLARATGEGRKTGNFGPELQDVREVRPTTLAADSEMQMRDPQTQAKSAPVAVSLDPHRLLSETIASEFEKSEQECRETLAQINKRIGTGIEFNGDASTAAHYRWLIDHYGSRARAVRDLLARLRGEAAVRVEE